MTPDWDAAPFERLFRMRHWLSMLVDTKLRRLTSASDLDTVIADSAQRPVLIFKHSLTCGVSAEALEHVEDYVDSNPGPVDAWIVAVQLNREVSSAAATRLGIRHETPQVLVVQNGGVMWHASHYRVTRAAVSAAMERLARTATTQNSLE
jgi:bacillithiol system protein YtxJ